GRERGRYPPLRATRRHCVDAAGTRRRRHGVGGEPRRTGSDQGRVRVEVAAPRRRPPALELRHAGIRLQHLLRAACSDDEEGQAAAAGRGMAARRTADDRRSASRLHHVGGVCRMCRARRRHARARPARRSDHYDDRSICRWLEYAGRTVEGIDQDDPRRWRRGWRTGAMTYPAHALDRGLAIREPRSLNPGPVGVSVTALVLGAVYLGSTIAWRQAALFLVGGAAGVVLYHPAFRLTSAWRRFIVERRGAALRAQMLMLAAASVVFFPALASGHV